MMVRWRFSLVVFSLIVLCGVTGCGLSGVTSDTTRASGVTPTRDLNGCPSHLIPVDGSPKYDVLVPTTYDGTEQAVTLPVGHVLEVRLSAGINWHLVVTDAASVLQLAAPQGWYNDTFKACIWEFSGNSAGQAKLQFSGGLVCLPNDPCPAIAAVQTYTITVK